MAESGTDGRPRISVIMAVRNGAATLQRALDSVFEQTYPYVELIVMDGASTDGTQAILERNADRIAFWRSESDRGVYHAWNKALDHATGDWICFLGADDHYHSPDALARMAATLADVEDRQLVVYGSLDKVYKDRPTFHATGAPWDDRRRRTFRQGWTLPHPATFHHRKLFERHGRFDERFRIAGDYEFLLRQLLDHDPLWVPVLVVDMAAGGLSDRPSNAYLVQREVYRARYQHGLETVPPWRSWRLFRRLCKIWINRHLGNRGSETAKDAYRVISRRRK